MVHNSPKDTEWRASDIAYQQGDLQGGYRERKDWNQGMEQSTGGRESKRCEGEREGNGGLGSLQ